MTAPNASFVRSTALKVAEKVRKTAPITTETYIAYGACASLVKECARQADYTMPQMERKARNEIPKSKNGEDLGVGKGWWYEGKLCGAQISLALQSLPLIMNSQG